MKIENNNLKKAINIYKKYKETKLLNIDAPIIVFKSFKIINPIFCRENIIKNCKENKRLILEISKINSKALKTFPQDIKNIFKIACNSNKQSEENCKLLLNASPDFLQFIKEVTPELKTWYNKEIVEKAPDWQEGLIRMLKQEKKKRINWSKDYKIKFPKYSIST